MWEIKNSFQLFSFAMALLMGVIFCLFYDILRAFRKAKKISDIEVFMQDVIYFLIIAIFTFIVFVPLSNGEIRGYLLIAIAIGFVVCFFTISRLSLKIFTCVFIQYRSLAEKFINVINRFLDKLWAFIINITSKLLVLVSNIEKILKKHLKKTG